MTPVASIIIPTYQHAPFVGEAIRSALAQTVPVEVIVVDDGSIDGTADVLDAFGDAITVIRLTHGGPSRARNAGIDAASAEYLMFLDADDVIVPTKIQDQLVEMRPHVGWVLCDVAICDPSGTTQLASARYGYAGLQLSGWIQPLFMYRNFVPIMAPLVRRAALGDLRFDLEFQPEDWHFWYELAARARARYVPRVLATYRKQRGGRNSQRPVGRGHLPGTTLPLRLNLGCGTPHSPSWHPMPGFANRDKSMGWRFEDGLPQIHDGEADAITISHALMYVVEQDWPKVCAEFARVLKPGGVIRITEDDTANPESRTYPRGWVGSESAVTLTSPAFVRGFLEAAGFEVHDLTVAETLYVDDSLMQSQHGSAPDVFFLEGVKR